jgi:hypothetical protein
MPRDLTNDVRSIFEPRQLAAGGGREDRDLAILALVAEARYIFAVLAESRFSVVM